jgi:MoxR-like ATPase
LVPDVVYFDNKLHTEVMAEMMKDFLLGENLLLIGSQGVGKNKIVDRY